MKRTKRIPALLLALLLAALPVFNISAHAEAGAAFTLSINGYMPTVDEAAGTVTIALPLKLLVLPANIINLTATLNLGSPNSAPFVFSSYQLSLGNGISVSGTNPDEYTFSATVNMTSPRNNGQYPIIMQLSYLESGVVKTQDFTIYVTITKGINPNATPIPTPATETPAPELPELGKLLQIDNGRVYPGMNTSYAHGYMPAVSDGVCYIVLPLYAVERIARSVITATPNYGETATAPFVFNNVQHTVVQDTSGAYVVSFSLPLKKDRVNGTYPLIIKTEYKGWTGQELSQDFTVYVTITDGKDPKDADAQEINFKPPVYIESYEVTPAIVEAGSECSVRFSLKNASTEDTVRNIKVSFKGENTELIPTGDSNTLFIGKLARGETESLTIDLRAMPDAKAQPHKVLFSIEYEDAKASTITVTDELLVQIAQPIRLEYDEPTLAQSLNAGDTVSLSMQVRNMGKSGLNNVLVKLDVPGLLPDSSAYLGNMDAGTAKMAEMLVFVGMRTMVSEGGTQSGDNEKYGYTSGKLTITYEDSYGKPYSEEMELHTTINAPIIRAPEPEPEVEQPKASQWWISLLIGGALLAAGIVSVTFSKKRRQKQVALDEVD